jgi:hypothetical protein
MLILFTLLVVYQFKHFIADFPLQGSYMMGKFKPGFGFVLPLLAHVGVHGVFTFVIAFIFTTFRAEASTQDLLSMGGPISQWAIAHFALKLALFDMTCHFIMDRIKASPTMLGRFKALSAKEMGAILSYLPSLGKAGVKKQFGPELKSNTIFWNCLGLDQMVHHLTHYAIIYMLVR